jgi:hypothetical protein
MPTATATIPDRAVDAVLIMYRGIQAHVGK